MYFYVIGDVPQIAIDIIKRAAALASRLRPSRGVGLPQ